VSESGPAQCGSGFRVKDVYIEQRASRLSLSAQGPPPATPRAIPARAIAAAVLFLLLGASAALQPPPRAWPGRAGGVLGFVAPRDKAGAGRAEEEAAGRESPASAVFTCAAAAMAAPGKGVVLAVGAAAAAGYSLYLLLRWRKYRVLFEPVYTAEGVPAAKRVVTKVKFGKVGTENRGTNPMDPPIEKDDDLFWMRDDKRKDHSVIAHLNRENAYFEHKFAPLRSLQATLYTEFVSHTKETDEEVPYPHGPYVYYTRTVKGLSYPIHCRKSRKAGTSEAVGAEEIVLDHNVLAKGKAHCDVQQWEMSPDHKLVAFTVDITGYETYDIIVRDLATGKQMDMVKDSAGMVVWGKTNAEFFYTTMDEEHRPHKLWRHKLGQPQSSDQVGKMLKSQRPSMFTRYSHYVQTFSNSRLLTIASCGGRLSLCLSFSLFISLLSFQHYYAYRCVCVCVCVCV
jgi:hypothetical protein